MAGSGRQAAKRGAPPTRTNDGKRFESVGRGLQTQRPGPAHRSNTAVHGARETHCGPRRQPRGPAGGGNRHGPVAPLTKGDRGHGEAWQTLVAGGHAPAPRSPTRHCTCQQFDNPRRRPAGFGPFLPGGSHPIQPSRDDLWIWLAKQEQRWEFYGRSRTIAADLPSTEHRSLIRQRSSHACLTIGSRVERDSQGEDHSFGTTSLRRMAHCQLSLGAISTARGR